MPFFESDRSTALADIRADEVDLGYREGLGWVEARLGCDMILRCR